MKILFTFTKSICSWLFIKEMLKITFGLDVLANFVILNKPFSGLN